jgi:hypothetical protein
MTMLNKSTEYGLGSATVNSRVVVYAYHAQRVGRVCRVVRATSVCVWLDDGERYKRSNGAVWGGGSARASTILDEEAFTRERAAAKKELRATRMRNQIAEVWGAKSGTLTTEQLASIMGMLGLTERTDY